MNRNTNAKATYSGWLSSAWFFWSATMSPNPAEEKRVKNRIKKRMKRKQKMKRRRRNKRSAECEDHILLCRTPNRSTKTTYSYGYN